MVMAAVVLGEWPAGVAHDPPPHTDRAVDARLRRPRPARNVARRGREQLHDLEVVEEAWLKGRADHSARRRPGRHRRRPSGAHLPQSHPLETSTSPRLQAEHPDLAAELSTDSAIRVLRPTRT